jgi:PAS domain S-box-containing protein
MTSDSEKLPGTHHVGPSGSVRTAASSGGGGAVGTALSRRIEAFVWSAGRAAMATDEENRIVDWNQLATDLLGFPNHDVIGRNLQDVLQARDIHGNRLCASHCAFHQMVRLGEAPESFELDVFTADGTRCRVAVSVVIVLGSEPQSYRLIYLMTPLRRRRRADEAIDRLLAEQRVANTGPSGADQRGRRKSPSLTGRQREVLALLVLGRNSREMADELGVSVHTVRSHVQNVLRALKVSSRVEAVSKALNDRVL